MYSPKRRMLQAFNSIEDENLRALSAELVQIYSESSGDRQPRAAYRAKVDSFARAFGADFSDVITPNELPAEKPDATPSRAGTGLITLRELTLCNFGSYRDVTTIDLSARDASRNVVVIVGSNGDGKSTLYYALNWALYGDEYLTELERDKGRSLTSLVNRGALEDAAVGNKAVRVSVTLSFQVRNIDYYVTREATVVAGHESAVSPKLEPTRLRKVDAAGNHTDLSPGALDSILSTLPKHVRDFYFFDGEQINKFVAPGARVHIRNAIRRVMGIDALEGTTDGVSKIAADIRREVSRESTGELEMVAAKLEETHDRLTDSREQIENERKNLATLNAAIDKLDELLSNTPDARPYQSSRTRLESDLKELNSEQEKTNYRLRELAHEASLLLAADAVSKLVSDLDARREAGVIPGPISRTLLSDLLKTGRCICGTDISDGTKTKQHIEETLTLLEEKASAGEASLALFYELATLSKILTQRAVDLDREKKSLEHLYERKRIKQTELADVEAELAGLTVVDRSGWENERREKREQVHKAASRQGAAEVEISRLQQEIKRLQELEKQIIVSNQRVAELTIRRNWAEAAEVALRFVHDQFARAARVDVEEATSRLWNQMLQTVERYSVAVSDDFELQVFDDRGNAAMQDLSMGQQQCLGLAFITAVAQVAESRPPLVIDMPFGRLGVDVASNVARTLPTLTEQLVLFVLPETEWNAQTKAALEPFVAREYLLNYNPTRQNTSVKAGDFH